MNTQKSNKRPTNFLDQYNQTIAPKLKEIDLFIKTYNELNIHNVSAILNISEAEVKKIMETEEIKEINRFSFFTIMKNGSSYICKIFSRELERGIPNTYLPHDISYIYNIDIDCILEACQELGMYKFNSTTLHELFATINL